MCASSRAAIPWACAASGWPRATASSRSSILPLDASGEERAAYLKMRRAMPRARRPSRSRARGGGARPKTRGRDADAGAFRRDVGGRAVHPDDLGQRLRQAHVVLRISASPGAAAKALSPWRSTPATANLVASIRSKHGDEIMLVTDGGQLIRCPVEGIRVVGRAAGRHRLQYRRRRKRSSRSSGSARNEAIDGEEGEAADGEV